MKTLVLGIGNTLLTDEGVGVHVIRSLAGRMFADADGVELMDGGTLSFTLAGAIEAAASLIVVDAAQLHAAPGAVRVFEADGMDAFLLGNRKSSVHEVGLSDLMTIAKLTGHWPGQRALVAIQPEKVDWGEAPTRDVAAAIPVACDEIQSLIEAWRNGAS